MAAMEWGVVLRWYLVLQILSIPFVYISRRLFVALPDQGYAIAKSLAVLLVGFGSWLAFAWLQVPFMTGLPWLIWLLGCGLAWQLRRRELRHRFHQGLAWPAGPAKSTVWMTEAVFALVFVGWLWVVAHDSGIEHTEQPMDFMFLNSLWTTSHYPPHDAWLAGFPISYYYFGYWMQICLAKASQVVPALAYNLGQANWYALLWLGAWSIGYNAFAMWHKYARPEKRGQWACLGAGTLSGLCVACMGNLQGVFESLYATGIGPDRWYTQLQVRGFPEAATRTGEWFVSDTAWWWWRSARIISDQDLYGNHLEVITEFPMFSYMLGDNHPHVLFAPFLFVAMSLVLQLFVNPESKALGAVSRPWHIGLSMVLAGAAFFSNSWDLVTVLLLLPAGLSLGHFSSLTATPVARFQFLVRTALMLLVGAALLILPYLLTAQSQVQGIQLNWINPTRPTQFLVMWGPLLLSGGLFLSVFSGRSLFSATSLLPALLLVWLVPGAILIGAWWGGMAHETLSAVSGDGTDWSPLIRERWAHRGATPAVLGLLLGLASAQFLRWWHGRQKPDQQVAYAFLLLCLTAGFLLMYLPEFLYLRDQFGALMRMNTVFKFYYQAWHLLAPVMAVTVMMGLVKPWKWPTAGASAVLLLLLLAGMVYPAASIRSKVHIPAGGRTLDIYRSLGYREPAVADALTWLQDNARDGAVIAEAVGQSYRVDTSRISGFTGMATLLGWPGHERQWRGYAYDSMVAGREEALRTLYVTGNREEILQTMEIWNIQYVYLGFRERQQYAISEERLQLLATVLDPLYDRNGILVLANPSHRTAP